MANAHQDPGPEGMRLFDTGYLVAVFAFLLFSNGFPLLQFLTHGNPHLARCRGEGEKEGEEEEAFTPLMIIGVIFWFLLLVFTLLISVRTRRNLRHLRV